MARRRRRARGGSMLAGDTMSLPPLASNDMKTQRDEKATGLPESVAATGDAPEWHAGPELQRQKPERDGDSAERPRLHIGKDALDACYDYCQQGFVDTRDMGAALRVGISKWLDTIEIHNTEGGRWVRRKALTPMERYVRRRANERVDAGRPMRPEDTPRNRRQIEPDDVAAKRRAYEEAARSGDVGKMTIAANELLRAVDAERARASSQDGAQTAPDDGRDPISQILVPRERGDGRMLHGSADTARSAGRIGANARKPYIAIDPITGAKRTLPQSDADVPPGHMATDEGVKRVAQANADAPPGHVATEDGVKRVAQADADVPPGHMATEDGEVRIAPEDPERDDFDSSAPAEDSSSFVRTSAERDGSRDAGLSDSHVALAAKLVAQASQNQREQMIEEFRERFGDNATRRLLRELQSGSARRGGQTLEYTPHERGKFERGPYADDGSGNVEPVFFPLLLSWVVRERGAKALQGAFWSACADAVVQLLAGELDGEKKDFSWNSIIVSAINGAMTGAFDFGANQWKYEGGLAFFGSIVDDLVNEREPSVLAAVGAAVAAAAYSKYGKDHFEKWKGAGAQGVGKFVSKALKEFFGRELKIGDDQLREFLRGFAWAIENRDKLFEYWVDQFEDMFWTGDDPYVQSPRIVT